MVYNIILWSSALLFNFLHPFHVSVTEISYNNSNKHLEISVRIFADDLENALEKYARTRFDLIDSLNDPSAQKILEMYLKKNFIVKQHGKLTELNFLGSEIDEDVIWSYLESSPVKNPETIWVSNTLLLDLFDDQVNLVHLVIGQNTRSRKYNQDNYSGLVIQDKGVME